MNFIFNFLSVCFGAISIIQCEWRRKRILGSLVGQGKIRVKEKVAHELGPEKGMDVPS